MADSALEMAEKSCEPNHLNGATTGRTGKMIYRIRNVTVLFKKWDILNGKGYIQ